jgi:hypothetical protein
MEIRKPCFEDETTSQGSYCPSMDTEEDNGYMKPFFREPKTAKFFGRYATKRHQSDCTLNKLRFSKDDLDKGN